MWETVYEFPNYRISNYGNVVNMKTKRLIKPSLTKQGDLKLSLVNDFGRKTRSLKVLVATQYVDGKTDDFNTPIHLDMNPLNCRADNLMWRPRWFAWVYSNQDKEHILDRDQRYSKGPIIDTKSGEIYDNIYHVAKVNGLIWWHIYVSLHSDGISKSVTPTWQRFEYL